MNALRQITPCGLMVLIAFPACVTSFDIHGNDKDTSAKNNERIDADLTIETDTTNTDSSAETVPKGDPQNDSTDGTDTTTDNTGDTDDTGVDGDTDSDSDTDSDVDTDTDVDADTDEDLDDDTVTGEDSDTDTENHGEADTGSDTETQSSLIIDSDSGADTMDGGPDSDTGIAEGEIYIRKTVNPPTIDGTIHESEWVMTNEVAKLASGNSDNIATFDVQWDDKKLYFAIDVVDENLCVGTAAKSFNYDSVEIYIAPDNIRTDAYGPLDTQIIFKYVDTNSYVEYGFKTTNTFEPDEMAMAGQSTTDGYAVEVSIAWTAFFENADEAAPIPKFGLDIGVNDDDPECTRSGAETRDGELRWYGTANNYQSTVDFGTGILAGEI